ASLGKRAPLALLRADVPEALERVVESLLSPVPDERPASAYAVLEELEGLGCEASSRTALAEVVRSLRDKPARDELEAPTRALIAEDAHEETVLLEQTASLPETEPLPS